MSAISRTSLGPPTSAGAPLGGLAEAARLEISWPVTCGGRVERLVWRVALGGEGMRAASAVGSWSGEAAGRVGGGGLTGVGEVVRVGTELWHVDVPGLLSATLRVRDGGTPELLYARTALLPAYSSPGSTDRPVLACEGWTRAAGLALRGG